MPLFMDIFIEFSVEKDLCSMLIHVVPIRKPNDLKSVNSYLDGDFNRKNRNLISFENSPLEHSYTYENAKTHWFSVSQRLCIIAID